ncbi:hypothetical protein SAMN04515617_111101 [Collimonas sp. OK242]|uniref:DUF4405 domain-containing protein n=1 Tax=Collimonas sp. OK242 TaxID=1798195 RepID=UPI000895E42F|nr:DUF4405 domain-containing protein [Collimonas sp. OK242]SDY21603.1 hypothetical protein SAMN04515617_111101 [Collimonas sp. OK242]
MRSPKHPKQSLHHPRIRQQILRFRLERWHRISLYGISGLLTASGILWLIVHYFLRVAGEFGETVNPVEPWSMKLHGAAAMAMLFFVGSLLLSHIRRAHHARRNRYSGWSMAALLAWLTISGYALYYIASEASRPLWSAGHWMPGLLLPLLLVLHIFLGRSAAR